MHTHIKFTLNYIIRLVRRAYKFPIQYGRLLSMVQLLHTYLKVYDLFTCTYSYNYSYVTELLNFNSKNYMTSHGAI